ncbi:hypothetical protein IAT38_004623 [Cryptococcus sp. DSM 104549]
MPPRTLDEWFKKPAPRAQPARRAASSEESDGDDETVFLRMTKADAGAEEPADPAELAPDAAAGGSTSASSGDAGDAVEPAPAALTPSASPVSAAHSSDTDGNEAAEPAAGPSAALAVSAHQAKSTVQTRLAPLVKRGGGGGGDADWDSLVGQVEGVLSLVKHRRNKFWRVALGEKLDAAYVAAELARGTLPGVVPLLTTDARPSVASLYAICETWTGDKRGAGIYVKIGRPRTEVSPHFASLPVLMYVGQSMSRPREDSSINGAYGIEARSKQHTSDLKTGENLFNEAFRECPHGYQLIFGVLWLDNVHPANWTPRSSGRLGLALGLAEAFWICKIGACMDKSIDVYIDTDPKPFRETNWRVVVDEPLRFIRQCLGAGGYGEEEVFKEKTHGSVLFYSAWIGEVVGAEHAVYAVADSMKASDLPGFLRPPPASAKDEKRRIELLEATRRYRARLCLLGEEQVSKLQRGKQRSSAIERTVKHEIDAALKLVRKKLDKAEGDEVEDAVEDELEDEGGDSDEDSDKDDEEDGERRDKISANVYCSSHAFLTALKARLVKRGVWQDDGTHGLKLAPTGSRTGKKRAKPPTSVKSVFNGAVSSLKSRMGRLSEKEGEATPVAKTALFNSILRSYREPFWQAARYEVKQYGSIKYPKPKVDDVSRRGSGAGRWGY